MNIYVKIFAACLLAVIIIVAIKTFVTVLYSPPARQEQALEPVMAAPLAEDPSFSTLLASADVEIGSKVARKCASCHTFEARGESRVGPNLADIVGAAKGARAGYAYSDAMRSMGGVWTYEDLNGFLTKPATFVPGAKMSFAGLPNREERAAVISFMRSMTKNAPPFPSIMP